MKTYYISIEWISDNSKLYSVSVPDYFNRCAVKTILSQYTHYKVLVYDEPHYGFSEDDYAHMKSIERLIKTIKNIKFYRTAKKSVRTEKILSAKTFYFPNNCNISTVLEIRDEYRPVTFFTVEFESCQKVEFCARKCSLVECLEKELDVRCSCINRLYLVGDWEIIKKKTDAKEEKGVTYDEYIAIEWEREVKEEQVEI